LLSSLLTEYGYSGWYERCGSIIKAEVDVVVTNLLEALEAVTVLIVVIFVVGTFITPGAAASAEAAFSGARHMLHDADTDGREVRPIPLLG
jgi:hypothetical protein